MGDERDAYGAKGPLSVAARAAHAEDGAGLAGRILDGKYRLVGVLGRGGMATVYEAEQLNLPRRVAVKVADPAMAPRPDEFARRFRLEVWAVALMEHAPGILPVYDVGEQDGLLYLVMRLVSGGTLQDRLRQDRGQPWPPRAALPLARQVLEALAYAHARGVVHRDVKPSNLLLDGDRVYLADFGIAKALEEAGAGPGGLPGGATLTGAAMVGTPKYMAPEQVLGLVVDARADLYAFGVVLYELLTGRVPYQGQTPQMVAFQHVEGRLPAPRSIHPGLAEALEAVLLRALQTKAEARYPTAEAFAAALEAAVEEADPGRGARPGISERPAVPQQPPGEAPGPGSGGGRAAVAPAGVGPKTPAGRPAEVDSPLVPIHPHEGAVRGGEPPEVGGPDTGGGPHTQGGTSHTPRRLTQPGTHELEFTTELLRRLERVRSSQAARDGHLRERQAQEGRRPSQQEGVREQREQAARQQVAMREEAARAAAARQAADEQAARDLAAREQAAAQEQAAREAAAREQAAQEQVAREAAAREEAARRAAEDQAAREQAARDEAAREQAARDEAARQAAAREQASREAAAREQAAREEAERERLAREASEQAAREHAARQAAAREQAARDQAAREEAARQRAAQEQAAKEEAARQAAARDAAAKEQAARQQAERVAAAAEKAAREQAAQERREEERRAREAAEQTRREQAARAAEERARQQAADRAAQAAAAAAAQEQRRRAKQEAAEDRRRRGATPVPLPARWIGAVAALVAAAALVLLASRVVCIGPACSPTPTATTPTVMEPLEKARGYHTTTQLPGGKLLVVGGQGGGGVPLDSTEWYDPADSATNRWTQGAPLGVARFGHTATLLPNGRVLVIGGQGVNGSFPTTVEQYDPVANRWAPAAPIPEGRKSHTATLLPNGQVLVVGGSNDETFIDSAERYDPATNQWTPAGTMAQSRRLPIAVRLASNQLLLTGGFGSGNTFVDGVERYDPATNRWTAAAALAQGRVGHTATLLANGHVLVIGGQAGLTSYLATTEEYDPETNRWTPGAKLVRPRTGHTATPLPNGQILVIGGRQYEDSLASVELYDPGRRSWFSKG